MDPVVLVLGQVLVSVEQLPGIDAPQNHELQPKRSSATCSMSCHLCFISQRAHGGYSKSQDVHTGRVRLWI